MLAKKTHRGIRSPEKQEEYAQRNFAVKYLISKSYNDRVIYEKVSQTSKDEVTRVIGKEFGFCRMCSVPEVCDGMVLEDTHGNGLLQL